MSVNVKCFDEKEIAEKLKQCPEIIREYVEKLISVNNNWQNICNQAIRKLNEKNKCMYCEKELSQNEAIILCKECTE